MSRYAEGTSVDVERTVGEIKRTLQRFGCDRFAYSEGSGELQIAFDIRGLSILMRIALPSRDEFGVTETGRSRTESATFAAWQQEIRRRARSLAAVIKAKLIAIDDDVATLEQEFLPYIVLDGVRTIGDYIVPKLPEITSGRLALPGGA
jgi:hypothetical protein